MPLCLDTEHISDYGFTVKINELHWGDTSWQERLWWKWASWRSGTVIGLFSHSLGILSRPIFNQSVIVVSHFCISLHLTGNKLLDLALSDMTERHVYYGVMKIKRWHEGSDLIICVCKVQVSEAETTRTIPQYEKHSYLCRFLCLLLLSLIETVNRSKP